ncbi:MAG: YfcE family phosphodiesterase [Epsilonproteobacteria bacterium]|nr:YfcE family phosphodiesterase [Campylobacterota bacterium]
MGRIAIFSDPHKKVDFQKMALQRAIAKDIQYILHLGDLEIEDNLKLLKETNLPYRAVFGNNDYYLYPLSKDYYIFKEPYYLKIENKTFKLMHLPLYLTPDSDFILYGHTHKFKLEKINNSIFLNPGEICAREAPYISFAIIDLNRNIIEHHFYSLEKKSWEEETFLV